MKITTIKQSANLYKELDALLHWDESLDNSVEQAVDHIISEVKTRGDKALLEFTSQFDQFPVTDTKQLLIGQDRLAHAWESISEAEREALLLAKKRITDYAERQKIQSWEFSESDGSVLGQKVTPIDSVGLYVPGGLAAYPSSVLMNVIPAKVAGVRRLVMVTPAMGGDINILVLAAAFLAEVDELYAIGGAQAVAALAYGTNTIKSVNKIVGPGNIYVATAKRKVFGRVAIDMIAGPSEIAIISDGSTDPEWIAADMFSQAEHDTNAQSILITPNENHANDVMAAMDRVIEQMPRKDVITESIADRGAFVVVESMDKAIEVANYIAPEHLELSVENADEVATQINNAGAIFIGQHTSEVLGDYIAGPNHVLPTSGTAKFSSPLGVYDFQKRSSILKMSEQGASELGRHAEVLANSEGLYAHALSAKKRVL